MIIPLDDEVLLEKSSEKELSDDDQADTVIATVLKLGPDVKGIKVGDKVIVKALSYDEIEVRRKPYLLTKRQNIRAIIT